MQKSSDIKVLLKELAFFFYNLAFSKVIYDQKGKLAVF